MLDSGLGLNAEIGLFLTRCQHNASIFSIELSKLSYEACLKAALRNHMQNILTYQIFTWENNININFKLQYKIGLIDYL